MRLHFMYFVLFFASISDLYTMNQKFETYESRRDLKQFLKKMYACMQQTFNTITTQILNAPYNIMHTYLYNHPYAAQKAYVRFSNIDDIGCEEKNFIVTRSKIVQSALEKKCKIALNFHRLPKIGLVFSGGGFRSLLCTCGFLSGMEQSGLLDAVLYCSTLSGSTWALAPWIASQTSISHVSQLMIKQLSQGLAHLTTSETMQQLSTNLITKILAGQVLSLVDIFGAILAHTLLQPFLDSPICKTLSETHAHVKNGFYPFPIYTAIIANQHPYEWIECTPFECGSSYVRSYIPTWAAGRNFSHGVSCDYHPEQTLGYFLGLFGSAFAINLNDAASLNTDSLISILTYLPELLNKAVKMCARLVLDSCIGQTRLFPAILHNFTYKLDTGTIMYAEETMELVDAGIHFNIPLPPLLRPARELDIIIIYDASSNVQEALELRKAEQYAQRKGYAFPPINYANIDKSIISIFDSGNKNTPIIFYFPRIKNEFDPKFDPDYAITHGHCHSFNFQYTQEQAQTVHGFAQFVALETHTMILNLIKKVLCERYGYSLDTRSFMPQEILSMHTLAKRYQDHLSKTQ